jgi:predicted phage terminase large subunit-like protein
MIIDSEAIGGFTRALLAPKYDNPKPIPPFHYELWDLFCTDVRKAAAAAPRGHAKSTAVTHAYVLAMMLFRVKSFCLLVSDTEGQAAEFLGDIKAELTSNEDLKKLFGVKKVLKDTETNIIVQFDDGEKFRIIAKGSEQKVRGLKWLGKRPDLIVGDDLENDDIVMNPERRKKFMRWLMNALIPCGSDTCWIRLVGTILHLDSALQRILEDETWETLFYEAHNPDFSVILWPEQYSRERLEDIRAGYMAQNDPEGYSQEYLNKPVAIENAFFNKDYFFDFERNDGEPLLPNLEYYAAADFAISEKERADYTAIVVCGVAPDGKVYVVDARRFRGDADEIISELLAVQKMWKPQIFTFETAKIDKAIGPSLEREMLRQKTFLNIVKMTPTQSKTMRARSIQAMHKSGSIRYDKEASWYPDFESELLTVSDSGPRGKHDDYLDAFAYVGLTINQYYEAQSDEEIEDEEWEEELFDFNSLGRSATTGY